MYYYDETEDIIRLRKSLQLIRDALSKFSRKELSLLEKQEGNVATHFEEVRTSRQFEVRFYRR